VPPLSYPGFQGYHMTSLGNRHHPSFHISCGQHVCFVLKVVTSTSRSLDAGGRQVDNMEYGKSDSTNTH
jgi:hypothetical protein